MIAASGFHWFGLPSHGVSLSFWPVVCSVRISKPLAIPFGECGVK